MNRILLCGLSLLLGLTARAHEPASDIDVVVIGQPSTATMQALGLRFGHLHYDHKNNQVRVEARAEDKAWLSSQALDWSIDAEASRALQQSLQPLETLRSIPGYGCYRTVEETADTIDELVTGYPLLATAIDIGDTWRRTQNASQGYDLVVLKLTNAGIGGDKPKMFVMSSVHAREYTPAELLTRYAEELLAGYGVDADATWLLDHMEFHFLLQANPDGRKRAETGLSWRKNDNQNHCGGGNSAGIDLNRNYPVFWNYGSTGSSTSACSETYRGPGAASEPETQAVTDYVRNLFPDTRPGDPENASIPASVDTRGMFLDVHSYSKLVLWPWGHSTVASGNADALATLGMRMAWFNDYEPQQSVGLYPTRGTTDDFAYGELGLPAYTIELGVAFFENCTTFENATAPLNLGALRYAARTLHAPYKLPAGPDAVDVAVDATSVAAGEPVVLTALIDDSRYRDQQQPTNAPSAPRPRHAIAGARYYVDQLPWTTGATGVDMVAADGSFNSSSETVHATLDTSGWPGGRHLVLVQGVDAAGEYGPPSAVFVEVIDPAQMGHLVGRIRNAADGTGIDAALVQADGRSTLSDNGDYALYVQPGPVTVDVSASGFVAASIQVPAVAAGQDHTLDVSLLPECASFEDDADNGNAAGWSVQSPWATAAVTGASGMAWTDSPGGNYANNVNTSLTSPVIDLAGGDVRLDFRHRCVTESSYDFGRVEVQFDGGAWTELLRCDGNNPWQDTSLPVPVPANAATLRFRFRLTSDVSQRFDGWSIDDIRLTDSGNTCGLASDVLFADGFETDTGDAALRDR